MAYISMPDGSKIDTEMNKTETELNKRMFRIAGRYDPEFEDKIDKTFLKIIERGEEESYVYMSLHFKKGDYLIKDDFQFIDSRKDFSVIYLRKDNGNEPIVIGNMLEGAKNAYEPICV